MTDEELLKTRFQSTAAVSRLVSRIKALREYENIVPALQMELQATRSLVMRLEQIGKDLTAKLQGLESKIETLQSENTRLSSALKEITELSPGCTASADLAIDIAKKAEE